MNILVTIVVSIVALSLGAQLAKALLKGLLRSLFGPRSFSGTARVVDGDTIDVDGTRVRLFGIDAPEMGQSQGPAARDALATLVGGRQVTVRPVDRDRWGRVVGIVECLDHDVCRTMVEIGCALADRRYTRRYLADERRARRSGAGLWASGEIQDGADFRQA